MSKTFDVDEIQRVAAYKRLQMVGQRYRHYKGGTYRVEAVSVHESIGVVLVTYTSEDRGYYWSRTFEDFTAMVNPTRENLDGVPRFARIDRAALRARDGSGT